MKNTKYPFERKMVNKQFLFQLIAEFGQDIVRCYVFITRDVTVNDKEMNLREQVT